jgi:hypothetical protein
MRVLELKPIQVLAPAIALLLAGGPLCGAASVDSPPSVQDRFLALPIAQGPDAGPRMLYRYGVPFVETNWRAPANGVLQAKIGTTAKKIYLLGMTEATRSSAWSDASSYAARFFVGDHLGDVRLHYADGSTQDFPLILGESVWEGLSFYQAREPFPADAHLRATFRNSLRLYPASPTDDGNYVAVIQPKDAPLESIEIVNSKKKRGSVTIAGITVEAAQGAGIPGSTPIDAGEFAPEFVRFAEQKPLRAAGEDEAGAKQRLDAFIDAFYTSDAVFHRPIAPQMPKGYIGPHVTFRGTPYANALENAFYANVQDMLDKVDADGTYHTSTKGALSWAGDPRSAGGEFGTFRNGVGVYYDHAWSRDLGRSLQELTELGYVERASHTADFAFRSARTWAENPNLTYNGSPLPPHWSRIINHPDFSLPFENDGHGLISIFIYKLWQRMPDRDAWLRAHWADVKLAGDWIPWQFDHARITGAKNGVLYTTGESAGGKGYSVYPDAVCMDALFALAKMADSIGETQSAALWRDRAEKMHDAIPVNYLIDDPKYGQVWTLKDAGWPNKSTVLGPLIFTADTKGFAPSDDDPAWHAANEAAYRRMIDTYKPFGFYGWAMGYGQGFVTQSALLLDRMKDATAMLNWMAREVYDPQIDSFVVPEGVQVTPDGAYIYRTGDQGNGVQEAEIVKTMRLIVGVDDTQPQRLRVFPRMPYGWNEVGVSGYPVFDGKEMAHLHYLLRRTGTGSGAVMNLAIGADRDLGPVELRVGPFAHQPASAAVRVNGRAPEHAAVEQSGDSWWIRWTQDVNREAAARPQRN